MTLIECFDRSVAENIVSCLHLRPEKLIFLGEQHKMQPIMQSYRSFFAARGMQVDVQMQHVRMKKMEEITQALDRIVRQEGKCVIDVTGGDERLLMAVGAMLIGLDERRRARVAVQKFDLETGNAQDCDGDGLLIPGQPVTLSAEELIALHGGKVHPRSYQPSESETLRDLEPLWQVLVEDPKEWNLAMMALEELESYADSREQVFLPLAHIRGQITHFEEKRRRVEALLERLQNRGILYNQSREGVLEYSFQTPLYRYCTRKVGNLLEVKVLLEARAAEGERGRLFQDCKMGVNIDWDGVIHNGYPRPPETRNEIDVMLMHGLKPVFVSCKSGDVDEEELYKLHAVTTYFGGMEAQKVLIATNYEKPMPSAFTQRAKDMDVRLVTDAATFTGEDWKALFEQIANGKNKEKIF